MRLIPQTITLLAAISLAALMSANAQQQNQTQQGPVEPIPAYHSPLAGAAENGDAQNTSPDAVIPDDRPLTGAQNIGIGVTPFRHSYWVPHVDLTGTLDSNANQNSGTGSNWATWTSISGGVDVHRQAQRNELLLSYVGGGMFANGSNAANGVIQSLFVTDKISFRRSTLSFFENVNYLPETSFGFGGLGFGALPGNGLGGNLGQNQTILTPRGQDLTNSSAAEFDERLTARTTLTFVGSYSLLHYFDTGLIDTSQMSFSAGYNYQATRKNIIGAAYVFSGFRYSGATPQNINTHTANLMYGRRVTGRLAFQVGAGPEIAYSRLPITISGTVPSGTSISHVYWSANANLQYQFRKSGLGVTYTHGVSGGSGALPGSIADVVSGNLSHDFSRVTTSGLNFGYSRNSGANLGLFTTQNQTYNYWFGGATIGRSVGRDFLLNLSYQAQYQNSNGVFCTGPTCGTNVLRHLITFGLGWRKRPIPFE